MNQAAFELLGFIMGPVKIRHPPSPSLHGPHHYTDEPYNDAARLLSSRAAIDATIYAVL